MSIWEGKKREKQTQSFLGEQDRMLPAFLFAHAMLGAVISLPFFLVVLMHHTVFQATTCSTRLWFQLNGKIQVKMDDFPK